jgi:hypothetical protein
MDLRQAVGRPVSVSRYGHIVYMRPASHTVKSCG